MSVTCSAFFKNFWGRYMILFRKKIYFFLSKDFTREYYFVDKVLENKYKKFESAVLKSTKYYWYVNSISQPPFVLILATFTNRWYCCIFRFITVLSLQYNSLLKFDSSKISFGWYKKKVLFRSQVESSSSVGQEILSREIKNNMRFL